MTIWESDGRVIYDNYNGRIPAELTANYYAGSLTQNNHGTRLEAQLATVIGDGMAVRGSDTIVGSKFYYWVRYTNKGAVVRVVRYALQLE